MTVWSFIQNKFIFYRQITGNVIYFYCPHLITSLTILKTSLQVSFQTYRLKNHYPFKIQSTYFSQLQLKCNITLNYMN